MLLFRVIWICALSQFFLAVGTAPIGDCVARLARHVDFFRGIAPKIKTPVGAVQQGPQCRHELMRWCVKKIHEEQSIQALFDVWYTFKYHMADNCSDDEVFVHDFAALIYVLYMTTVMVAVRATFQDFMILYNQVLLLPLPDLLDLIDIFFERIGVIFNAYNASHLSYVDLVREYWWAPIAIGAALATGIMQWYLRSVRKRLY